LSFMREENIIRTNLFELFHQWRICIHIYEYLFSVKRENVDGHRLCGMVKGFTSFPKPHQPFTKVTTVNHLDE
jgi:hypothetical protein